MTDMLRELFELQEKLQRGYAYMGGKVPQEFEGQERLDYIKGMHTALSMEAAEALDETGWKPWASSRHVNEDAHKGEVVDMWFFLMNWTMAARMSPQELYERYREKLLINLARQQGQYTGVAEKCPGCKRALDTPETQCNSFEDAAVRPGEKVFWCHDKRQYFSADGTNITNQVHS